MLTKSKSLRDIVAVAALTISFAVAPGVALAQAPSGTLPAPAPRPSGSAPAPVQQPAPAQSAPQAQTAPAQAAPAARPAAVPGAKLPPAVVGVIDMGIILRDGAPYKSLRAQIDSQTKAWDAELKKKGDDLRKLEDDFRKQAASLTPEQVAEKRKQFETQMADYQRQFNTRRRQLAEGEAQSVQPIEAALSEILQQVAIERGINVIVYRNATPLFASDLDISADVLQRLNAKLPRVSLKLPPAQAAAPAAAAAPKSN